MAVLVGKTAPDFTALAVMGNNEIAEMTFSRFTKGQYAVVFFYPLDFTFVCPSELIAFDHRLDEFKRRNVEVIGISIDSAARSRLASLYSGQTGFDIYTRAVSEVYQDLFGEGSFTGTMRAIAAPRRVMTTVSPRSTPASSCDRRALTSNSGYSFMTRLQSEMVNQIVPRSGTRRYQRQLSLFFTASMASGTTASRPMPA